MDMLVEGAEEVNDVRRDVGPGQKGATVRELMREEVDCFRGEPLRRQLRGQILQREGAAKEKGTRDVCESRGDIHKEKPPGVGAK
eukprot:12158225-Prorocentrum_lima.AAC.1